jgi:beta-glucosidase
MVVRTTKWALAALLALGTAVSLGQGEGPLPESVTPVVDDAPTKANDYDWLARHERVLERVRKGNIDLVLIGDSITHMWGGDPLDPGRSAGPVELWNRYFAPRKAVNLGFGWDRTEHVLWRLEHGEIDGIRPKVAVVQIGTNNLWKHSPDDIALGIKTIVKTVRKKLPRTQILLVGIFPRDHEPNTFNRQRLAEVNAKIAALDKERNVTYIDIGQQFLEPDGTISPEVMPDFLHLSPKGCEIWAEAMEPTLCRLMRDKSRSIKAQTNPVGG